jgi:hypothetical protein
MAPEQKMKYKYNKRNTKGCVTMTGRYRLLVFPFSGALFACAVGCSGGGDVDLTGGAGGSGASVTTSTVSGTGGGSSTAAGGGGDGGGGGTVELEKFSFFVTSIKAMQELSNSQLGFGGDLTFGESGPGAGLRGADKICATIAEKSMPGSSQKQWRAFLSATAGEDGNPVNAIDRVGEGPWYDRLGRVVASTKADLVHDRPLGADPLIVNDLPNEDGVPNHQPDPSQPQVDNHHMLTGSTMQGTLDNANTTCLDWTSANGTPMTEGKPRVGLSWPRMGGMGGSASKNWMSALIESGCAPGVNIMESGPPDPADVHVGSGGGYGGIYCFALTP